MPLATNGISPGSSIIFKIPARLTDVRLLSFSVHALFSKLGFNDIETYQLELAVTESANNIVEHAYQYEEDVFIDMEFSTTDDRVTGTFVDYGRFDDFLKNNTQGGIAIDTKVLPSDSRGLYIICKVMDEVSYRRSGGKNILKLVKYLF